jgi:hypothetical protein
LLPCGEERLRAPGWWPLGDDWLITGATRLQPKPCAPRFWKWRRASRERMREYWHFQCYEARDAVGTTTAERSRRNHGRVLGPTEFVLSEEMTDAETVAVIYDEVEGMSFYTEFGLVEAAFDNPDRAKERRFREVVLGYLNDDTVSPLPLRRLAERDPDRASRLFQRLLKRPNFSWERDGEALLRKHKASHYAKPVVPRVAPVGGALLEHYRGEPDKGSRRMGATSRRRSLARA